MSTLNVKERSLLGHVIDELSWDPKVDAHDIAVSAEGDIIGLAGTVRSYFEKQAAARAALRVKGVKGVANNITIQPPFAPPSDAEIAHAVENALALNVSVPADAISLVVSEGRVSLKGVVQWNFQREAARRTAENVRGVAHVTNDITLTPVVATKDVRKQIVAALHRDADVEASGVTITTAGNEVVLRGHIRSWNERKVIENAAWAAPGVTEVRNELTFG